MAVLVSDSFNRANSTNGMGTTDSYNGGTAKTWQYKNANLWGINNNQAYQPTSYDSDDVAFVDAGQSDNIEISLDLPVLDANGSGVAFRYQDGSNFFRVVLTTSTLYLQRYISGGRTTLSQKAVTIASPNTLKVVLSGTSITVYYNGVSQMTATDSNLTTATKFGLANYLSTSKRFDNFQVVSTGSGVTPTGTETTKSLSDSISFTDTLTKTSSRKKSLTETISFSDTISKQFTAMVVDTIATGDSENENISKAISDTVNSSDTFTSILRRFIILSDGINTSEEILRNGSNQKGLSDSITITDSLFKQLTKLRTDSIVTGDTENERLAKTFLESISTTDTINAVKGKAVNLLDAITITDSIRKSLFKTKIDTVSTGDSENESTSKKLSDAISQTDTLTYTNGKGIVLTDYINVNDVFAKSIIKLKLDSLGITDTLQKQSNVSVKLYDVVVSGDSINLYLPNAPEYKQIIEYIMKINPEINVKVGIAPVKEFRFKI